MGPVPGGADTALPGIATAAVVTGLAGVPTVLLLPPSPVLVKDDVPDTTLWVGVARLNKREARGS